MIFSVGWNASRVLAIRMAAVAALCVIVGCTPAQQQLANTLIPAAVSAVDVAFPGAAPVLTAAASLACTVQADANALPVTPLTAKISTEAGGACVW